MLWLYQRVFFRKVSETVSGLAGETLDMREVAILLVMAALTLSLAETIAATASDKPHLVFAPARFVPQKKLLELGVEHAPLPYALYRIEKG